MSPCLIIFTVDAGGLENVWLVDAYVQGEDGDLDLYRSGEYVITLGADDYCNGLVIEDWDGDARVIDTNTETIEIEEDEDGDVYVNITLPTVH